MLRNGLLVLRGSRKGLKQRLCHVAFLTNFYRSHFHWLVETTNRPPSQLSSNTHAVCHDPVCHQFNDDTVH